jgi:hypothetical protein
VRRREIAHLAALPPVDYQAERAEAAQRLGVTLGALDRAVKAERARRRGEREGAHRRQPPPGPGEVQEPFGYFRRADGLFGDPGGDAPPVWLAAPFEVLGETRDAAGAAWGLWLRWQDGDGTLHTHVVSACAIHGEPGRLEGELHGLGLRVSPDPRARMLFRRLSRAGARRQPRAHRLRLWLAGRRLRRPIPTA